MTKPKPNLLWVDLETTGLSPEEHLPLEIAVVVTDSDLNELYERSWVISQVLIVNDLDPWVFETHSQNGLIAAAVKSGVTVESVKKDLANLMIRSDLWPWDADPRQPPLCGSSIQFERLWLAKFFPEFYKCIHYRSIDVSSIKELMLRWQPEDAVSRQNTSEHRALADIRDSIDELKSYRSLLWGLSSPLSV